MAQADGRRPLTVEARFNSSPVHVESVVGKFELSSPPPEVFQLSPLRTIPPILHIHLSPTVYGISN